MNPNPDNYCTLELSQRLVAAGIVLKTEKYWVRKLSFGGTDTWLMEESGDRPAPNLSELWRELPGTVMVGKTEDNETITWDDEGSPDFVNANPCDALAELCIWVKGGKG